MSNDEQMNQLALSQIEHNLRWLNSHIRGLSIGVRNLPSRPQFTSAAELDLEELEERLMETLSQVRATQLAYQQKPIFRKSPDVDLREACHLLSLEAAE